MNLCIISMVVRHKAHPSDDDAEEGLLSQPGGQGLWGQQVDQWGEVAALTYTGRPAGDTRQDTVGKGGGPGAVKEDADPIDHTNRRSQCVKCTAEEVTVNSVECFGNVDEGSGTIEVMDSHDLW